MKSNSILKEKEPMSFGELDAGDMFIGTYGSLMLKLNEDIIEDFLNDSSANAIFIEDGTGWNFDNGDEVQLVKQVALED